MKINDLLLFVARYGFLSKVKKKSFRAFHRRNRGLEAVVKTDNGFYMRVTIGDSVDNKIYVYRNFEKSVTKIIENLSKNCREFIDVGCNIGYYSCLVGNANKEITIYCVDPNPEMVRRTEENLNLNKITNYTITNVGIGSKEGVFSLNIPQKRHSLSSFAYIPSGGPVTICEAKVIPFSSLLSEKNIKDCFVKIDTEGFEFEVFSGFSKENFEKIKYILFEFSSKNLKRAGKNPNEITKFNFNEYYEYFLIDESRGGCLRKVDPLQIVADENFNVNVLLVRKDLLSNMDILESEMFVN